MSTIGYVNQRVSDVSGKVISDEEAITVVIRSLGKRLDATADELAGMKRVSNVVELELQYPDGREEDIIISTSDFSKVMTDEVLERADSLRGRRQNWRPGQNGN